MVANIWVAAADNQISVVEDYIQSKQFTANSQDPNGYTPIHAAASYGHIDLLKVLMANGGDINIQDKEGDTPLHHVEDLATAKFLVEELKADFSIKNDEGQTALEFIEEEDEFPQIAQYLRSLMLDAPTASSSGSLDNLPSPGMIEGHQVRYSMSDDAGAGAMDQEQREKLHKVINSENPEMALRELVTSAVREGLADYLEGQDRSASKRVKEN